MSPPFSECDGWVTRATLRLAAVTTPVAIRPATAALAVVVTSFTARFTFATGFTVTASFALLRAAATALALGASASTLVVVAASRTPQENRLGLHGLGRLDRLHIRCRLAGRFGFNRCRYRGFGRLFDSGDCRCGFSLGGHFGRWLDG